MMGLDELRRDVWTTRHTVAGFVRVHALLKQRLNMAELPGRLAELPLGASPGTPAFRLAGAMLRLLTRLTRRSRRQPCLYRTLVLHLLARDARMETEIAVGIAPLDNGVRDHVWLLHRGEPLGDTDQQHRSFPQLLSRHGSLIYMTTKTGAD